MLPIEMWKEIYVTINKISRVAAPRRKGGTGLEGNARDSSIAVMFS